MTVRRLDKLSWSRSGRPLSSSERKTMLGVLKRARRDGRLQEHEAGNKIETREDAGPMAHARKRGPSGRPDHTG